MNVGELIAALEKYDPELATSVGKVALVEQHSEDMQKDGYMQMLSQPGKFCRLPSGRPCPESEAFESVLVPTELLLE
jgi:hypothetical protein